MKYFIPFTFFVILLSHCTGYTPSGAWYLEGDHIKFDFLEDQLTVSEDGQLIFQALQADSSRDSTYKITKIGSNPIIQGKYNLNQRLTFRKPLLRKREITLVVSHSGGQREYRLFQQKDEKKLRYFSLLHPVEQKEFLEDPDFIALQKVYKIKAYTNNMKNSNLPLLIDGDIETAWSHRGLDYLSKDFFEFFFIL